MWYIPINGPRVCNSVKDSRPCCLGKPGIQHSEASLQVHYPPRFICSRHGTAVTIPKPWVSVAIYGQCGYIVDSLVIKCRTLNRWLTSAFQDCSLYQNSNIHIETVYVAILRLWYKLFLLVSGPVFIQLQSTISPYVLAVFHVISYHISGSSVCQFGIVTTYAMWLIMDQNE